MPKIERKWWLVTYTHRVPRLYGEEARSVTCDPYMMAIALKGRYVTRFSIKRVDPTKRHETNM